MAGSGAAIDTGPTSSTLHDCPWYTDTAGTTGDSGISCATAAGVAKGTITVGATTVPANGCLPTNTTYYTQALTGVTTSSALTWPTPPSGVGSITGFGPSGSTLYFVIAPTSGTYNWQICNSSASPITPGSSTTWNIGAIL